MDTDREAVAEGIQGLSAGFLAEHNFVWLLVNLETDGIPLVIPYTKREDAEGAMRTVWMGGGDGTRTFLARVEKVMTRPGVTIPWETLQGQRKRRR